MADSDMNRFDSIRMNIRFRFAFVLFLAAVILPVVQKQHQLLVTLLLCNAAAMEVSVFGRFFFLNGFGI